MHALHRQTAAFTLTSGAHPLEYARSSNTDSAPAEVVKLVDTLASGASARKGVEVQVLSSAPIKKRALRSPFLSLRRAAGMLKRGPTMIRFATSLLIALMCSPALAQMTSQMSQQAQDNRPWLMLFPLAVLVLVVVLVVVLRKKK